MERENISNNTINQRRRRRRRKKLLRKVVTLMAVLTVICITMVLLYRWIFGEKKIFSSFGTADIVLDAGHGGKDAGANHGDLYEKDINLAVAKKTKELLSEAGYKVKMTREDDTYAALSDRVAFANQRNAKVFVSIHCNSSEDGSGNGIETFYAESKSWNSEKFAESIQKQIINATGAKDRDVKTADYAVILGTDMSAALVEVGFLTDKNERTLLQKEDYQQKLAEGIAEGILEYLGTDH